jgi:hypothetical protein
MFACRLLLTVGLISLAANAQSAIYKCPDGQFQDKPCANNGASTPAPTRPEVTTLQAADEACAAVGKEARRIAQARADGGSAAKMLADAEAQDVPFARKQTQKKLITEVFSVRGTPSEIASRVEGECIKSRKKSAPAKK